MLLKFSFFCTVWLALFNYSNSQNSIVLSGVGQLEKGVNHSGITVQFDQIAPIVSQRSTLTNPNGVYSITLTEGLYLVTLKKAGYFSVFLGQVSCFGNVDLPAKVLMVRNSVIRVPSNFASIQSAIDDSFDGDTVLLNSGTYLENIDLRGKKILLTSNYLYSRNQEDIKNTIIDGGSKKSVIVCSSFEAAQTVLAGFTVRNGRATGDYPDNFGGGIRCIVSSPTLENLIVENNYAQYGGGGVFFHISSSRLNNVKIINNFAERDGGGIRATSSDIVLRNAIIAKNQAYNGGGIIGNYFNQFCRVEIINSTIVYNRVTSKSTDDNNNFFGGSGVKATGAELILKNSIVAFNEGDYGVSFYHQGLVSGFPLISYSSLFSNGLGNFFRCNPLNGPLVTKNINNDSVDAFFNLFTDPLFYLPEKQDYQVVNSSPSVDAGYNAFNSLSKDIYSNSRIENNKKLAEPRINMGACEATIQSGDDPILAPFSEICENGKLTLRIVSLGKRFRWFTSLESQLTLFESGPELTIDTLTRSVTLYVANADFPILSKKIAVSIYVRKKPTFLIANSVVTPNSYRFEVTKSASIDSYEWTVSNTALTSKQEKPLFEFDSSGKYTVCVKASNSLCTTYQCSEFDLIILTTNEERGFLAFPNPVEKTLFLIDDLNKPFAAELVDLNGHKITSYPSSSEHEMNFENLTNGFYIVKLNYGDRIKFVKVLKH